METLPLALILFFAFLFGAIFGSFANVVICRLHTGKSLNNRSHCLSCGRTLSWYELVPVLSYLLLLGRCRTCGCFIPVRYLLVELTVACSFVLSFLLFDNLMHAALMAAFSTVLIIGAVYDLYHLIIPDEVVLWGIGIGGAIVLYLAYLSKDMYVIGAALISGLLAFLAYAGLWYVSNGRWIGFGDAKLAVPLGAVVGIGGVFSLVVLSFWVGAVMSLFVIGYSSVRRTLRGRAYSNGAIEKRAGYLTMKHEVPFAPFLIIAFYLVAFFHVDVLEITSYVLTYFV